VVEVDFHGFGGLLLDVGSAGSTLRSLGFVNAGGDCVTLNAGNILLVGTYIGLQLDGATAAGNGGNGLSIRATSFGNTVGGASAGAGNVISGNAANGIGQGTYLSVLCFSSVVWRSWHKAGASA
jgi:hypothetical protein